MKKLLIHLSILSLLAFVALPMVACAPKQKAADETMDQPAADQGDAMDKGDESMGDDSMDKGDDSMDKGDESMGDDSMDKGDGSMSDDGGAMNDDGGSMDDQKPADQGDGSM